MHLAIARRSIQISVIGHHRISHRNLHFSFIFDFSRKRITMKYTALLLPLCASQSSGFTLPQLSRSSTSLSAKHKIFIDGEAGTTGLQVRGRIEARDDLEIISPPFELRKDEATRKKLINEADCVILCEYYFSFVFSFSSR